MNIVALVAAIVATLIPIVLIVAILFDGNNLSRSDKAFDDSLSLSDKAQITAIITVVAIVCYVIVNVCVYYVTSVVNADSWRPATFTEAQEASGFQSAYSYPLVLGDRGAVSYSSQEITHGLFYFNMTSQTISGSSVLVGYEHTDGTREIIEIPISMINFQIVASNDDSSLSIDLGAIDAPADGYTMAKTCGTKTVWGWWVYSCTDYNHLTTPGNEGVAGLLQRAFAASSSKIVTMTVTEEQYAQILGAPEGS